MKDGSARNRSRYSKRPARRSGSGVRVRVFFYSGAVDAVCGVGNRFLRLSIPSTAVRSWDPGQGAASAKTRASRWFDDENGGSEAADPCPAGAPDLSACSVHHRFADCGGAGEPRLGCSETQGCLWFSEGCVAAGFTASDCPADNICCHSNWPYDDSDMTVSSPYSLFYGWGLGPWDDQPVHQ
jgi:hypothetical protein